LLLGIDDTGAITRYFPADGETSATLPAGARVQLPVAIELDHHRGQERIVALTQRAHLHAKSTQSVNLHVAFSSG
jgi:hypothetical protein